MKNGQNEGRYRYVVKESKDSEVMRVMEGPGGLTVMQFGW